MLPRLFRFFLVIAILSIQWPSPGRAIAARQATSEDYAQALLDKMAPDERVGQLFLVTFDGYEAAASSQLSSPSAKIYNLISQYHIGGVVLARSACPASDVNG